MYLFKVLDFFVNKAPFPQHNLPWTHRINFQPLTNFTGISQNILAQEEVLMLLFKISLNEKEWKQNLYFSGFEKGNCVDRSFIIKNLNEKSS